VTLNLRNRIAPILGTAVPRWGRGRVDTFNPYKAIQFNWPIDRLPHEELIGASDFPSLWNQKPREGLHLHWDGDNDSVDERNLSAALGAGVTPVTVDHDSIKRVRDWIWTLPPPKYPYAIDSTLAARGASLYGQSCVACHGDHRFRDGIRAPEATRVGLVEDIDRIRTDRHRLDSYTDLFAANQYALYPESEYRFTHFRKTRGLRQPSARRHLGPRALSAQRLCPDAARSDERLRANGRKRSIGATTSMTRHASASCRTCRRRKVACSFSTTRPFRAMATAVMNTGRRCLRQTKAAIVEYLKTF
jgi:hypothetical protein